MTEDQALADLEGLLTSAAVKAANGGHSLIVHSIQWLAGALRIAWPTIWAGISAAVSSAVSPSGLLTIAVAQLGKSVPWLAPFLPELLREIHQFLPTA